MLLMGVFVAFFGNKFLNFVIGLVGFLASTIFLVLSIFWIISKADANVDDWVIYLLLVLCLVAGGGVGYILIKSRKAGVAIMATWGGVTLGFILTTTLVIGNVIAYWAIIVASAAVCGFLAFKFEKLMIMLSTALIGSYLAVRGISMYAGGFPNETSIRQELESGGLTWDTFPKTFYAYLAGILILSITSFVYQVRHNRNAQKVEGELK
jgi:hypothetical protein